MRLSPQDNVAVALRALKASETVLLDDSPLTVELSVAVGGKLAARGIADGEIVVKYNCPIGIAKRAIEPGERIDQRNVETNYLPVSALQK
jgi:altronate hydrolase